MGVKKQLSEATGVAELAADDPTNAEWLRERFRGEV
jgi:hypothetical protein